MKKKPGTLIIELNHVPAHMPTQLDETQQALFRTLPPDQQEKVRNGIPMGVVDLETGKTLAVFNRQNISGAINQAAALELLYECRKFYQDPENERAFLESEYNHERTAKDAGSVNG